MKLNSIIGALLIALGTTPAWAQPSMQAMNMANQQAGHRATAVVKEVRAADNAVVLSHDAIPSLQWPAMTMPFKVKDPALLRKLQPGRHVTVELTKEGGQYLISSVKE